MNVSFKVNNAKTISFTNSQWNKVDKAVEILNKIIKGPEFKNMVCSFNWTTENGITYNRFHMSNSMSNTQVWNSLSNGCCNWGTTKIKRTNNIINVVPCFTAEEYKENCWSPLNIVCVNVAYVSNKAYTPVHIASAIFHEYCVNCCGFSCMTNGAVSEHTDWTVPYACANIVKNCATSAFPDDFEVQNWAEQCNHIPYNYYPACMTWGNWDKREARFMSSGCVNIDKTICAIETELECINNCKERSNEIADRMTVLKNCLGSLKKMQKELFATSLDGSEIVIMPTELPAQMSMTN